MIEKKYKPITITPNFYQLGTRSLPAYLSLGEDGMIIEGGTGVTFTIIVNQIKELGVESKRIKYIALTHTHADHIGAIPRLKKLWPHLKVVASPVGEKMLTRLMEKEGALQEFIETDRSIADLRLSEGEVDELPSEFDSYTFGVDMVVKEGDSIDLGSGIVWKVYETPGHAACHISFFNEKEGILVIGDATGFHSPELDVFWPNYFESLELYCNSIRKLATLPARMGVLCHNGVIERDVKNYLQKAMKATESYHLEMLDRVAKGEDIGEIASEKTKWINTFTCLVPPAAIKALVGLSIKRSQSAPSRDDLFTIP